MHHRFLSNSARALFLALGASLLSLTLPAASFTVTSGTTDNSAKTLNGAGQTGTVESTGTLSVSGGTTAITVTANASVTNSGTIKQTGSGRAIDLNTAGVTLSVTNTAGATIQTVNTDAIRVNQANNNVVVYNAGTIAVTNGGQALDFAAIVTGTNVINNYLGGIISAVGEDAIRPGNGGIVYNAGTISATPIVSGGDASGSDGIDLRTSRTVTVNNDGGTITGRHGIATDGANAANSSLTVTNSAGGVISALNGSGINVDGVNTTVVANVTNYAGATIKGGVLAATAAGDGDGVDVDGVLTLTNEGDILGLGAKGNGSDGGANNAEAVSIGGGTINNNGRIIGSTLLADAANGEVTRMGNGILVDNSSGGNAIAATTIINSGLIQGKTGFGVKIVGGFDDSITNLAGGTIQGGKAASAASYAAVVDTGAGNDKFTNGGSIISDGGPSATAITLGTGNDSLRIIGDSAVITGITDGGVGTDSLTFDLGSPTATFTQNGAITGFEHIDITSGDVKLTGSLNLGDAANTLAVQAAGILDLGVSALTMEVGSVVVDGTLKVVLGNDSSYGQLLFALGNPGGLILGAGSILDLDLGYSPLYGTQFTLVGFAGSGAVSGTFAGLAEGAVFMQEGHQFQITYQGNGGNDIVLTSVPDVSSTFLCFAGGLVLLPFFRRRLIRS